MTLIATCIQRSLNSALNVCNNYITGFSLEHIIHMHIMTFITHHRLLSESQHDFREARSCVTQLLQRLHLWYSLLIGKDDSVNVIFLDFAKAFDKVSHHHLLYTLKCYGIRGHFRSWFHDYHLSDHTQGHNYTKHGTPIHGPPVVFLLDKHLRFIIFCTAMTHA